MIRGNEKQKLFIRALRLPFLTASILPFIAGSLFARGHGNGAGFILGFIAVAATHLSANLINDYADSRSGADWGDRNYYNFFGGSKLIQEGVLRENFYFNAALFFAALAAGCVLGLAFLSRSLSAVLYFSLIIILAWAYSQKPLCFSYRRMGELIIFILFGPAPVMGGYFIQSGIFPDLKSFLLSVPFGLFTTAILFANEIPDFFEDDKAGKHTWVGITGVHRAFILYAFLILAGFAILFGLVMAGYLGKPALIALIFLLPAAKAARILQMHPADKTALVESSKLTITVQAFTGVCIIAGVIL